VRLTFRIGVLASAALAAWAGVPAPTRADPPTAAAADSTCGRADGIEAGPRQAALLEARRAKCARLERYEPGFLERQVLAFEKAERPPITRVNLFGLYPRIGAIDHRSQSALGVRLWRPDIGGSRLDLAGSAFWSRQGFQFFDLQAGVIPHRGTAFPLYAHKSDDVFELANVRPDDDDRYALYASMAHRWAPKFDFFGSGADSRREDRADFSQRDTLVQGVVGYRLLPRLMVSGRLGYYHAAVGPGRDDLLPQVEDVFASSAIPGFGGRPDFLRYGAEAAFDARDVAENPHRGGLLAVQWLRYDARGGGASSFGRFAVDGRLYVALGHPQRVLALRAYGVKDDPSAGGAVPFYLTSYLGGSHTLRAFGSQRFRGEKLALLQAEYRWEAAPAIELALFADSGAVAATSDDELGRFRTDGGIGLRFKTHEAVMLRLDFAWGDEGFRFLFRFSPSF
jgi:hypothetical protein